MTGWFETPGQVKGQKHPPPYSSSISRLAIATVQPGSIETAVHPTLPPSRQQPTELPESDSAAAWRPADDLITTPPSSSTRP